MTSATTRGYVVPELDSYHYVPALYARAAETGAVSALGDEKAGRMTPIWVIPPIPVEPRTGVRTKTPAQHLDDVAKALMKAWDQAPAFVDTHRFVEAEGYDRGLVGFALNLFEERGLRFSPVIHDGATLEEKSEIADFALSCDRDLCLRVSAAIWAELGTATGDAAFGELIDVTRTSPHAIHLVVDLMDQVSDPASISAAAVRGAVGQLAHADEWRSLTVLGTAMPTTTAEVGVDGASELPRSEWAMWKILREARGRRLSFGDYAVQSTDSLSTFNPLYMQTAAQLRYTISSAWFVARGASTRTRGFEQSRELAQKITQHGEFAGRDFSAGDAWIADRAAEATGPGNATTWRKVTTNHHLAFVLSQLANLRGF